MILFGCLKASVDLMGRYYTLCMSYPWYRVFQKPWWIFVSTWGLGQLWETRHCCPSQLTHHKTSLLCDKESVNYQLSSELDVYCSCRTIAQNIICNQISFMYDYPIYNYWFLWGDFTYNLRIRISSHCLGSCEHNVPHTLMGLLRTRGYSKQLSCYKKCTSYGGC